MAKKQPQVTQGKSPRKRPSRETGPDKKPGSDLAVLDRENRKVFRDFDSGDYRLFVNMLGACY